MHGYQFDNVAEILMAMRSELEFDERPKVDHTRVFDHLFDVGRIGERDGSRPPASWEAATDNDVEGNVRFRIEKTPRAPGNAPECVCQEEMRERRKAFAGQ